MLCLSCSCSLWTDCLCVLCSQIPTLGGDTRTTLLIRNIPRNFTQQMLKEDLDATHSGTYDFLFLSFDSRRNRNVGYAFVNFSDVGFVITFAEKFGWYVLSHRLFSLSPFAPSKN
ncbi:RNA recognition motif 2-domain-containing protein [Zychaea mexicana]|uniref:RNA recognition motif 2-domain-containing protein n=1 Tax=Zychaea mexicana TaxID=64656 RepID=UPI0022FEDEC4|nr:RNA recognition motif 2-domain-containing protein [Zychaea mexicana]KAI9484363.1 RNA recognition motif 2-domain-containing protein [Zychaea mexicana]